MSGSKIVGDSPDPFCPTCGDQAVLAEEVDGKTEHRCANGHEWTVATDGGHSRADRTDGEIDWPAFIDRTPPRQRERTAKFRVPMGKTIDDIETELEDRLEVDDWRLSTAAPHRKKDGRPYADANPDDPGAVVRWTKDTNQYAIAADEYDDLRDNLRAIGLYIAEKRKMSNRPVKTGQDEFATAQLPSGNEDAIVADAGHQAPHEILGVEQNAPEAAVRGAYRGLLKERHPDHGGSPEEFAELQRAKEAMLDG